PSKGRQDGWCRRRRSATRKRGILRRCAPQDDNLFVILSGTTWSEESRACAIQQPPSLRGGSIPPKSQSEAGGTGARCAPLRGQIPRPWQWVSAGSLDLLRLADAAERRFDRRAAG